MTLRWNPPPVVERVQKSSLMLGGACLALLLLIALREPTQFFRSYLFAYVFWIGIPLGSLAFIMLHHLTGGRWGFGIRGLLEACTRTLPLMTLLFVPLLFGLARIYLWAQPAAVAADPTLQYKRPYLNAPFFLARAAIYFLVWLALSSLLNRWSRNQDRTNESDSPSLLRELSGPGLVLYGLTVTFASGDWVMSIERHGFSSIYGMRFMVVQVLAALAFTVAILPLIAGVAPFSELITPQLLNDLGNFLLTFVMLWAYLAFSQFLIIWSGNLKEEIPWYTTRANGAWAAIAVVLLVLHFGVPFLLLLSRNVKQRLGVLAAVAAGLVALTVVDVFWLMVPGFLPDRPRLHWMDLLALMGIGGVWFATFLWQLQNRPLLPLHDPELRGALQHGD